MSRLFRLACACVALTCSLASAWGSLLNGRFTPLKTDEHPCIAENLKEAHRYLCDDDANVICLHGWKEPEDEDLRDLRNPCPLPVCEYEGETCQHGECVRPDVCACNVGWEGHLCDKCLRLPGCEHGTCTDAFGCDCARDEQDRELWTGAFCDKPACPNCPADHGTCYEPNVCTCNEGWEGRDCLTCQRLPGCVNGDCEEGRPNTCSCRDGWTGHLCDQPICTEDCHEEHGYCEEPFTCLCKTGWEGATCSDCVSYWRCPDHGTCVEPNQCICQEGADDQHNVCNRVNINGPRHADFDACSTPCKFNPAVGNAAGERRRACRWAPGGEQCQDVVEECYGDKDWVTVGADGEEDLANCIARTP